MISFIGHYISSLRLRIRLIWSVNDNCIIYFVFVHYYSWFYQFNLSHTVDVRRNSILFDRFVELRSLNYWSWVLFSCWYKSKLSCVLTHVVYPEYRLNKFPTYKNYGREAKPSLVIVLLILTKIESIDAFEKNQD